MIRGNIVGLCVDLNIKNYILYYNYRKTYCTKYSYQVTFEIILFSPTYMSSRICRKPQYFVTRIVLAMK